VPSNDLENRLTEQYWGKGEWLLEKHKTATRRSWRALHLCVDAGTGRIVASTLTSKDVDDASQAGPLLDQVAGAVASFTGDGGYDQDRVYASVAERHPGAAIVKPPTILQNAAVTRAA